MKTKGCPEYTFVLDYTSPMLPRCHEGNVRLIILARKPIIPNINWYMIHKHTCTDADAPSGLGSFSGGCLLLGTKDVNTALFGFCE